VTPYTPVPGTSGHALLWDLGPAQGDTLFSLRNNLRYGCVIRSNYIDREKGDLFRVWRYNDPWANPNMPTW